MPIKVGINGFGRIGRYFTRVALNNPEIEIVAINDLTDANMLAHLFKFDSVHGRFDKTISNTNTEIVLDGKSIKLSKEKDPSQIPWGDMGVDVVVECTGIFRSMEKASLHLKGGAKKVVISAPADSADIKSVVIGVNENILDGSEKVISNASCTTNSAAPLVSVMKKLGTINSCYITTIHSYTSDQNLHDAPHKDLRRARAAAESIIPTSTGAAKAITKIFPELSGKMGGGAVRVPVPDGSMTDMTFVMEEELTLEEINAAFKEAASSELKGVLSYCEDPIVSRDIIGDPHSGIYDSLLTTVVGKMVKVVSWYDNEAGYSHRLVELTAKFGS